MSASCGENNRRSARCVRRFGVQSLKPQRLLVRLRSFDGLVEFLFRLP
jgi:hypothetical protein